MGTQGPGAEGGRKPQRHLSQKTRTGGVQTGCNIWDADEPTGANISYKLKRGFEGRDIKKWDKSRLQPSDKGLVQEIKKKNFTKRPQSFLVEERSKTRETGFVTATEGEKEIGREKRAQFSRPFWDLKKRPLNVPPGPGWGSTRTPSVGI